MIFDSQKIDNAQSVWWLNILQEPAKYTGFRLSVAFTIGTAIYFVPGQFECQTLSFEDAFYFGKKRESLDRNQNKLVSKQAVNAS